MRSPVADARRARGCNSRARIAVLRLARAPRHCADRWQPLHLEPRVADLSTTHWILSESRQRDAALIDRRQSARAHRVWCIPSRPPRLRRPRAELSRLERALHRAHTNRRTRRDAIRSSQCEGVSRRERDTGLRRCTLRPPSTRERDSFAPKLALDCGAVCTPTELWEAQRALLPQ